MYCTKEMPVVCFLLFIFSTWTPRVVIFIDTSKVCYFSKVKGKCDESVSGSIYVPPLVAPHIV